MVIPFGYWQTEATMRGKTTVVSSTSRKNKLNRWLRRTFSEQPCSPGMVLMIMGAQRSGTTLFSRIFDDLYYADVFGEFSVLSSNDKYGLRLNTLSEVKSSLARSKASLVVMKPLVESQKANFWISGIPGSVAVWLYRDFSDVASSNVAKFGEIEGGINHARAFVDEDFARRDYATWKSENASKHTIETIKAFYHHELNPYDASALFWHGRNVLYKEQRLQHNGNVILVKYEEFVRQPFLVISFVLNRLGIHELSSSTLSAIDGTSIGKGKNVSISPQVTELCTNTLGELDDFFYKSPLGVMLKTLNHTAGI